MAVSDRDAMVVTIHEYELRPETGSPGFEAAISRASEAGLFDLPGLVGYRFLRGIKGEREGRYTALWYYANRDAWRDLWGPVDDPVEKDDYPAQWRRWEDEYLDPLIVGDSDDIRFTSYRVVQSGTLAAPE